jgi:hypothetical protein
MTTMTTDQLLATVWQTLRAIVPDACAGFLGSRVARPPSAAAGHRAPPAAAGTGHVLGGSGS